MTEDVTTSADWTTADPSIVRSNGSGTFTAVRTGDTYVVAAWEGITSMRPVSVFPNMPPLPTYEISGGVWQAGSTLGASPIDGAVIQILDGLVAGRTATSGVAPHGGYSIMGVPPGTYHLQVTKSGYVTQQVTVTVPGPAANFPLQPS